MMPLNLHHLRLFHAVARDGSLNGAARRLNLSPSALSAQLKALEAQLGAALFERRGRTLALTEAGRIALDHAEVIFRTATDLATLFRGGTRALGALRVGALSTLSRNFQIEFLRPVLGRADVEVVVRSGSQAELLAGLSSLALDVVLTNLAPTRAGDTSYVLHRLAEQPVSLIGTPRRLASGGTLEALIAREPLILPTEGSSVRAAFDVVAGAMAAAPRIAAEVDDMALIRLLARADAGLAVIPPIVVRDELVAGVLVEAHPLPGIAESFLAVTLERRFPHPLLAELLPARPGPDAARAAG